MRGAPPGYAGYVVSFFIVAVNGKQDIRYLAAKRRYPEHRRPAYAARQHHAVGAAYRLRLYRHISGKGAYQKPAAVFIMPVVGAQLAAKLNVVAGAYILHYPARNGYRQSVYSAAEPHNVHSANVKRFAVCLMLGNEPFGKPSAQEKAVFITRIPHTHSPSKT